MSSHGTVSIHAPARGATSSSSALPPRRTCFNSRAREGRDRYLFGAGVAVATFQFTRPRGARRLRGREHKSSIFVSIHAPARGATHKRQRCPASHDVSIHAPARGATVFTSSSSRSRLCFNSRAREGRDRDKVRLHRVRQFQFTRPRGARPLHKSFYRARLGFQFTRPRGARLSTCPSPAKDCGGFNSRAREGRDVAAGAPPVVVSWVSIHAPARGATLILMQRK